MLKRTCPWLILLVVALTARAEVQLPALFSDNLVLQQGMPVTIWGWADEGEQVTVKFHGQTVSATTHNLKWSVKLRALKAGGPDTLTIATSRNIVTLNNVLVGEVWLCSGQSNMEFPLNRSFQSEADIASATNQIISLFHVPKAKSDSPTVKTRIQVALCRAAAPGVPRLWRTTSFQTV